MASEIEQITQAVEEFYEYAHELVRARREDPSDDLISKLIAAEEEGERLSDVECINLVFNVLVGGVDTSQSQLAHAIRLLAEHPEQWQLLADGPVAGGRARSRRRCATSRSRRSRRASSIEEVELPRRDVPGGHGRDGVRVHRQPRPRRRGGGRRAARTASTSPPTAAARAR